MEFPSGNKRIRRFSDSNLARAKRDAREFLEGRAPWDFKLDDIIEILQQYPDDPDAADYCRKLMAKKDESAGKES